MIQFELPTYILCWHVRRPIVPSFGEETSYLLPARPPFYYEAAQLRAIQIRTNNDSAVTRLQNSDPPKEMRRRKRGKAGKVQRRSKTHKLKPYIPLIFFGKCAVTQAQNGLSARTKYMKDFRNIIP